MHVRMDDSLTAHSPDQTGASSGVGASSGADAGSGTDSGSSTDDNALHNAEQFVDWFAKFWANPTPAGLAAKVTSDVVLYQPMSPPHQGKEAAVEWMQKLLALAPDLRGEVDDWSAKGPVVFIRFRMHGTFGSRFVEWPIVDRFVLENDLFKERRSYFDSMPLALLVLRTPSMWLKMLRSGALAIADR